MRGIRIRALGVIVAVTTSLVAVSGTGAGAATTPTVTIGIIAPVDAGLVEFGRGIRDSVFLAARQALDQAKVKGWTVVAKVLDDSSDPAKGKTAASTFAADPSVVAVIGPYNSGVALEAAPVLAAQGLALISPANTLTSLTVGENPNRPKRQWKTYFRMVGSDLQQAEFLAAEAKDLGVKTVAVVSETKAVSKGLADQFAAAFKDGGGKVTVHQTVPDGAKAADFTSFITAAKAATPDLVFFGGEYNVAATLRTAATAGGVTTPIMGGDGINDPAYVSTAGALAKGTYASTVGVPSSKLAGYPAYLSAYQGLRFTSRPTDYGPYAYDAANVVIDALAKILKNKTELPKDVRKQVVAAIQKTKTTGVTGRIAFDSFGDARSPTFTLYKVDGTPLAWTPIP